VWVAIAAVPLLPSPKSQLRDAIVPSSSALWSVKVQLRLVHS